MIDLSGQNVLIIGEENNKLNEGVSATFKQYGAKLKFIQYAEAQSIEEKISAMAELDTVVINPPWFSHLPFLQASLDDIDEAIDQNYEKASFILQYVAKHFIQHNRQGSIILLSSIVSLMPLMHNNLTGSTLAALEVVAKMAAVDLGQYAIRVNLIAVGWIKDRYSQPLLDKDGEFSSPEDIPLKRVGTAEDVGRVCGFLASPLSNYVTGVVLPVDGGFLLTKSSSSDPYRRIGDA